MKDHLSIVTALAAVLLVASLAGASPLAEALPPDVYVFIDIPDLPAARAAGAQTAYGEILAEPEVARFIESGFPALSDIRSDFRSSVGRSFRELLDFCKGDAAFAVLPASDSPMAALFIMNVGKETREFEAFLADAEKRTGYVWDSYEIPGATVKAASAGSFSLMYTVAGDRFILSNSSAALATAATGILSGPKESLAADPGFGKCLSFSTLDKPQVRAYVNSSLIFSSLAPLMPPQLAAVVKESGIQALGGVFFASRREGRGFVDEVVYYFPSGREGVFAAVNPVSGRDADCAAMIPALSMNASWDNIDFKALVSTATALYSIIPEETRAEVDGFLSEFETSSGVNLKADLVDSLGRNVISYSAMPTSLLDLGLSGGFGQHVTLVELSDAQRLQTILDALWKYGREHARPIASSPPSQKPPAYEPAGPLKLKVEGPVKFSTHPFGAYTIYQAAIPLSLGIQIVPALSVKEGWLILGTDVLAVKSALGAPLTFKADIRHNSDYAQAAKIVGSGNAGISYTNTRASFDSLYPMLAFGLPFVLAQLGGNVPTDQILLPPASAISPHLFGAASSTTVSPYFIRVTSYGPIGLVRTTYVSAVAGAALTKWFVDVRQAQPGRAPLRRQPPSEADDLQTLAKALSGFAAEHGGAYPEDAEQLRGILATPAYKSSAILQRFCYVPGFSSADNERLILAFDRNAGPAGRRVLLVGGKTMHFTDVEVTDQVGGWLNAGPDPAASADSVCLRNVATLAASVKRYAASHDGSVPESLDVKTYYRFAPLVTACPAGTKSERPNYATVTGINIAKVPDESKGDVVLVYETGSRHEDRPAAGFLDGAARRLPQRELKAAVERTKALAK